MGNFLNDQFEIILGTISGALGGLGGWLMGRKKNRAEVSALELDNIKTILDIHKEELSDLRKYLLETRNDLKNCRQEMEKILIERLKQYKKG